MFLGPGYHFWLFLVCSSWWESPGFSMSTWPLWCWLPGPGSPNGLRAAKPNPPNLRRLRCCRRPFLPTSRLHLQCSLILSPNFSYFDLYRPFVSISGKFGDDLWWFTVALLTLRLGTCAPWCAMQVSSLSGKVVDKLSKPLSRYFLRPGWFHSLTYLIGI